ncbi:RNA polymerase I-specific transcription initiation factor-domain-containing protein [Daldinia sp. FL1419]|nr:RNA polymerase I-specific transcription initiation factor-domain-containing protein [Daldinia sp. FL1419]
MASTVDESDEYLPSDDSDDFSDEDERPNRWHGPQSTWQHFNRSEIDTLTALKEIQDRDLSIHLYNAFALKQGHKKAQEGPIPHKDINEATGQPVQPDDWLPHRSWTAWPMRADKVPPPEDGARSLLNDRHEAFTLRKDVLDMPSTVLEEIIGAEILKTAKEKFNARPRNSPDVSGEEADSESQQEIEDEDSGGETEASTSSVRKKSGSRSKSVKLEYVSGDERMDVDEHKPGIDLPNKPDKKPVLKPVVSTDDDLSYNLLRPSVRHILTKLDATLTILHNTQESALNYQSDSADSEASDSLYPGSRKPRSGRGSQTPTGEKRRAGRPLGSVSRNRSRGRSRVREDTEPPTDNPPQNAENEKPATKRRAGRPKKIYPRLEGETDREYTIRIARLQKKPLPRFSDESDAQTPPDAEDSGNSGDAEETTTETSRGRGRVARRKRRINKEIRSPSQASSASGGRPRNAQMSGTPKARIGLRDWRDVLGAAALAGFSADAVDRAARRCADLFGQSITLHTLAEGPSVSVSGRKAPLGRAITYVPGMPRPPLLEEDEEEKIEGQRPARATSMAPSAMSENEAGPSQQVRGRPRSRSRSASAAPGYFTCLFPDCPRAAEGEGFLRRYNMLRHMKLVHGYAPSEAGSGDEGAATGMGAGMPEEVDSEDEMHGAVHVDWFLRPIKMRKGWRANDVSEESRARRSGRVYSKKRERGLEVDGGEDDDGDTRMGGGSD